MKINKVVSNNIPIAVIESDVVILTDVQSALDLMATVRYEVECSRIVMNKTIITEDFFHLSTRLAGEILQKYVNYQTKLAIYGDFSMYNSKSLKDFIYECNQGKDVFFVISEDAAINKLAAIH